MAAPITPLEVPRRSLRQWLFLARHYAWRRWFRRDHFHFVDDYEAHVRFLMATLPLDDAMSEAVGGNYVETGAIQRSVLIHAGLSDGMTLVDYGCGSGRLASALSQQLKVDYLGIDVIEALLAYARSKSAANYVFVKHRGLTLPADDASADMVCAFSVFTHLMQSETYLYLQDMHRVLKPGGRLVFSFLEFDMASHWTVFDATLVQLRANSASHLNLFLDRGTLQHWARRLGYRVVEFVDGDASVFDGKALGQSIAIFEK